MAETLPQVIAQTFTCGLVYGIYLVTVCYANRWLLFADEGWKIRKNIHWAMVLVTNLISAMALAKAAISVQGPMRELAFVELGHPRKEYVGPPWEDIVECTLADSIALLADTVLLYRVWVTYGRKIWVIYFPLFLWVGGLVCTALQLFLQVMHVRDSKFGPYQWADVNMTVGPGIVLIPFWASTIALNAYCTGALTRRIWIVSKSGGNSTISKQLQFLVMILIESGAIYLATSLAHFIVWFGQSDFAILLVGAMNAVVIGIAYNLIIIRTAYNRVEAEGITRSAEKLTTMVFNSNLSLAMSSDCDSTIRSATDPGAYRMRDEVGTQESERPFGDRD